MKVYQYIDLIETLYRFRKDLKEQLDYENVCIEAQEIFTLLLNDVTQELDRLTSKYSNAELQDRFFNGK